MKKVGSLIRQLLPRRDVPLRQNSRAQKLLLLLLTPLTAFWLMQLVLGSPPWNMSAGVALANWLCLSALYWIGCAIIGYPAVCCVLLHILAGMWGGANDFVSVCRGTCLLYTSVLSDGEAGGIPCVAVKCVDIRRNTSGEGGLLDIN